MAEGSIVEGGEVERSTDATGMTISPGLVEVQVNGGWGHDFTDDPSSIWKVGERLPAHGVTSFCPTIVTAPYRVAELAIEVVSNGPPPGYSGASVLGLHIEGPWLSAEWAGAHNRDYLTLPDSTVARDWAASQVVAAVTIAPELAGAEAAAGILAAGGVTVSAGHTGATYEQAMSAFAGPWSCATHLYNAMTPFRHREPGVVGAVFDAGVPAGLIADGIHCHPAAVRLAWSQLGPGRLVLTTDAMAAAGLGTGRFRLGEQTVEVGAEGARTSDGRLAGSSLTLDAAVRNLETWLPVDASAALACASANAASMLGVVDRGRIETGARADVVVMDADLEVVSAYVRGVEVFSTPKRAG